MANEVPIIIGSDDEDSDNDDVVLIKEEIEVEDDNDDVIFLSETKASPRPEPEPPKDKPELALRSLSVPDQVSSTTSSINRSLSISSCAGRLSLDDGQDAGLQCDSLPLLSNLLNASGPLDLSSKSGDNIQAPLCGSYDTDITGSGVPQSNSGDSASLPVPAVWQGSNDSTTVATSFVADAVITSQCSVSSFPSCSVSGNSDSCMTSNTLPMGSGNIYTDITVLPGGFMANTAMLPQLDNTTGSATSLYDANGSDLSNSKYLGFSMGNGSSIFTNIPISDTSVSFSTNCNNTTVSFSAKDAMDTSDGKVTDARPSVCTDQPSANQESLCTTNASPAITSNQSCGFATSSVTNWVVSDSRPTTALANSSMFGNSSVSSTNFSGDPQTTITSLSSSDNQPCTSASKLASLSVSISNSGLPPVSSCASAAESASTSSVSLSSSCGSGVSSSQMGSICDPLSTSQYLMSSLVPAWQTSTTCSGRRSPLASSAVITSLYTSLPVNTSADSSVTMSVAGLSGLPGGSSSYLPAQQLSTTNVSTTDLLSQSHGMSGGSNTSFNVSTSNRLYNPLTLPIYMQNKHLKHSLSLSALSNRKKTCEELPYKRQCSFPRTTPLPPKKQKRCYSDGSSKCANCSVTLIGEKFSRCPNGHTACAKCLEEKVKLLLTGKAKESVRCLDRSCDSFYPVSELKLSLPSIVVEILEDKLDQEYVDYISDMMLKNASGDTDQPSTSGDPEQERFHEYKREESFPDNWNAMEEHVIQKKGYVLVQLEQDTPEYEQVVLQFFQSMVDQNVEVTSVHRVQNPIQWKYYCVKKSEIQQDNDGFALEKQLFHGTSATVVDAICRRGFDWRVCGKHGTLYGQGSYFAGNASYSHQYTDLKPPRHLSSSMMLSNPMSMTLPTTPSLIYPPVNINFGQPLNSLTFTALNLSHNSTTTPTSNASTVSAFQTVPSSVIQQTSSMQTSLSIGQTVTPVAGPSLISASSQRQATTMRYKVVPKQPAAIRTLVGHPSSGLMPVEGPQEIHKGSAKVFLARVLVGRYVKGHPKLRKPPPLYPRQDPFGKCFDSCVDEPRNPKIFVIFDSAQAYPEYLLEYSFSPE